MSDKILLKELLPHVINRAEIIILNHQNDYVGINRAKANGYYFLGKDVHVTYEGGSTGKSVSEFKLMVRPLWLLTKEITHNGETFVPVEWFEIGDDENESLEYTFGNITLIEDLCSDGGEWAWRPSIFMPKGACRLFLRITDIRVERLDEISEEDAVAEGCEEMSHRCGGFGYYEGGGEIHDCDCQQWEYPPYVMGFRTLWESINGKGSWGPTWVWVVNFERIEKPDNF